MTKEEIDSLFEQYEPYKPTTWEEWFNKDRKNEEFNITMSPENYKLFHEAIDREINKNK